MSKHRPSIEVRKDVGPTFSAKRVPNSQWRFRNRAAEASPDAQRRIRNEVGACDLQRMSSHKRLICSRYWNGESLQGTRSKKALAGRVCLFFLGRPAYRALELGHHGNMAFCMLKLKRRIAILPLRCFNIDIDQLTPSERVLTDRSNDPSA
jgi:hypothetical protein